MMARSRVIAIDAEARFEQAAAEFAESLAETYAELTAEQAYEALRWMNRRHRATRRAHEGVVERARDLQRTRGLTWAEALRWAEAEAA